MMEIRNIRNFDLRETVTCGQIFRYSEEEDNSYTIILDDRVINVKYDSDVLYVLSNDYNDLEEKVIKYFDLYRDYDEINKNLISFDKKLEKVVLSCEGLKMINSYPFETLISYIISANNSVPSITKSVNMISQKYGKKIMFNDKSYYLFPTPNELKDVKASEFRTCSVGFRDKYIENIVKVINSNPKYLDNFNELNAKDALPILLNESGIGPKIASCVLLFAYQKHNVFPIDTWVKKFMKENYNIEGEKNIRTFTQNKYKEYSGIAIQYMFHYGRNIK